MYMYYAPVTRLLAVISCILYHDYIRSLCYVILSNWSCDLPPDTKLHAKETCLVVIQFTTMSLESSPAKKTTENTMPIWH